MSSNQNHTLLQQNSFTSSPTTSRIQITKLNSESPKSTQNNSINDSLTTTTSPKKLTKFFVKFSKNEILPSITASGNCFKIVCLKRLHLSNYFKQLDVNQRPKPLRNLLGSILEDRSSTEDYYFEENRRLVKYLDQKYKNFSDVAKIDLNPGIDNPILKALIDYCGKVNHHHLNTKFTELLFTKLKLIGVAQEVLESRRSLSDSFALSPIHNSKNIFSVWKYFDLLEETNTKNSIAQKKSEPQKDLTLHCNEQFSTKTNNNQNQIPNLNLNSSASTSTSLNIFDEPFESVTNLLDTDILNSIYLDFTNNVGPVTNNSFSQRSNLDGIEPPIGLPNLEKLEKSSSDSNLSNLDVFANDPRYKFYLDKLVRLLLEVLNHVVSLNFEHIDHLVKNAEGFKEDYNFKSVYVNRLLDRKVKIIRDSKLINLEPPTTPENPNSMNLYKVLSDFLEIQLKSNLFKTIPYAKGKFIKQILSSYTCDLIDNYRMIKSSYEAFLSKSQQSSDDFFYEFNEFKLFVEDLLNDLLLNTSQCGIKLNSKLDIDTIMRIRMILQVETCLVQPDQLDSNRADPRLNTAKKNNDIELKILNLNKNEFLPNPNPRPVLEKFNEKLYKKLKYSSKIFSLKPILKSDWDQSSAPTLNTSILSISNSDNDIENLSTHSLFKPLNIEEDQSELNSFSELNQLSQASFKIPLFKTPLSTSNSSFFSPPPKTPVYNPNQTSQSESTPGLTTSLSSLVCNTSVPITPIYAPDDMFESLLNSIREEDNTGLVEIANTTIKPNEEFESVQDIIQPLIDIIVNPVNPVVKDPQVYNRSVSDQSSSSKDSKSSDLKKVSQDCRKSAIELKTKKSKSARKRTKSGDYSNSLKLRSAYDDDHSDVDSGDRKKRARYELEKDRMRSRSYSRNVDDYRSSRRHRSRSRDRSQQRSRLRDRSRSRSRRSRSRGRLPRRSISMSGVGNRTRSKSLRKNESSGKQSTFGANSKYKEVKTLMDSSNTEDGEVKN